MEPTERELEILKVLWAKGRGTVREVWDVLRASDPEPAYTTVLSLLQIMEQKGLVRHEEAGRAYVYIPSFKREPTVRKMARAFVDRVFDGAVEDLLARAIESRRPSDETLDALERIIAEAKAKRDAERERKKPS